MVPSSRLPSQSSSVPLQISCAGPATLRRCPSCRHDRPGNPSCTGRPQQFRPPRGNRESLHHRCSRSPHPVHRRNRCREHRHIALLILDDLLRSSQSIPLSHPSPKPSPSRSTQSTTGPLIGPVSASVSMRNAASADGVNGVSSPVLSSLAPQPTSSSTQMAGKNPMPFMKYRTTITESSQNAGARYGRCISENTYLLQGQCNIEQVELLTVPASA